MLNQPNYLGDVSSGWTYATEQPIKAIYVSAGTFEIAIYSDPVSEKLESFAKLLVGWDYGRGGPLSADLIAKAKEWYSTLAAYGFAYINAFPGSDTATLAAALGDHRIELMITSRNGALTFGFAHDVKRKQQFYETNLSEAELRTALARALGSMKVTGEIWNASTYYTRANMTRTAGSSRERHFGTTVIPSRSSVSSAQTGQWDQFAPISNGTLQSGAASQAILPSFGDLIPHVYIPRVA